MNQRMFHGGIAAAGVADQLAARFRERHTRVEIRPGPGTVLVQLGSGHGTPLTVNLSDTTGGVLVSMGQERDWLDRAGDVGDVLERAAAGNPFSILAAIPEILGEFSKENLAPQVWNLIGEICALSRALAGEKGAPANPKVCLYCGTANPAELERCQACGAALAVDLPRACPKCGRSHTSDALFCQACGTRLVEG
jgi:hypothetical protein